MADSAGLLARIERALAALFAAGGAPLVAEALERAAGRVPAVPAGGEAKACPECDRPYPRKRGRTAAQWAEQKYCSSSCSAKARARARTAGAGGPAPGPSLPASSPSVPDPLRCATEEEVEDAAEDDPAPGPAAEPGPVAAAAPPVSAARGWPGFRRPPAAGRSGGGRRPLSPDEAAGVEAALAEGRVTGLGAGPDTGERYAFGLRPGLSRERSGVVRTAR